MSNKLWGGRFSKEVDASIIGWTESVTIDGKMVVEDLWGSLAHVTMLGRQGIIPARDAAAILGALLKFQDDFIAGEWKLKLEHEDVHMNVEARLIDALGIDVGGKMHTCRSRNDQVPLDSKLYTRRRLLELRGRVIPAIEVLLERAAGHTEDVMVSYTHVQHAQPISIAYWLSHYAAIFLRDLDRLAGAYDLTDENPLGTGAIAGTSFPIDRRLTTDLLGFQRIHEHGLDATSSRDFMLEVLSASAIMYTTISRLAEEFIFWSSYEFRTLTLDEGFAMGSSMMPQKKNPGTVELLRGRSGRMNGLLVAGLTMMKGLPSGYNRDFHEEKEILWEALDLVNRATEILPALLRSTTINKERMAELSYQNFATATELANYLVKSHNVPFRQAHHIVGSLVGDLYRRGENFSNFQACFDHLKASHIEAPEDEVRAVLDPKQVMMSYRSQGGTGPDAVKPMLASLGESLAGHRRRLALDQRRVTAAYEACRSIAREAGTVTSAADLDRLITRYLPVPGGQQGQKG
ncbi:MAG: argininosuccinate lyase [Myxococcales bacterium]|nr:argininosuccinate lyase [Myxococcales bacterium]